MERATVNVATGAMGPVLQKLTVLLVQDQYRSRINAGTRGGIEFIKFQLTWLQSHLLRIWEREDLGTECENWMADARALSYDMEDGVDDFMLGLEASDGGEHGRQSSFFETLFWEFKVRVVDVSRQCLNEWRSAPDEDRSKGTEDPRAGFLNRDPSELVGMDKPKEELITLLLKHEMVCIHGLAGVGKTTLADLVYQEIGHEFQCRAFISLSKSPDMPKVLEAIHSQVTDGVQSSGSRSTEAATEENLSNCIKNKEYLSNQISNFLSDKRYLMIIDDIWHWEKWEIIRRALPEGVPRCILATTRVNAIAEKFDNGGACIYRYRGINDEDAAMLSRTVFNKKPQSKHQIRFPADSIYHDLPYIIPSMCRGMPLAVECLSSAVATSLAIQNIMDDHYPTQEDWGLEKLLRHVLVDKLRSSTPWLKQWAEMLLWHVLVDGLRSSSIHHPSLKPLAESLRLGYDDLPLYLKTCLLYCSMYPTGYLKIERHGLVRKWIAEGFVYREAEGEEAAAAAVLRMAEGWLDELVSRGLLQPESSEDNKQYYSVHPMMRAFLVCKSKQANFVAYLEDDLDCRSFFYSIRRIRRLSVSLPGIPDDVIHSAVRLGGLRVRSLVVFSSPWLDARDLQSEHVRVLSIESSRFPLSDIDLADICSRQLCLRYLGLKVKAISALPRQIGKLKRLETLDISDTGVSRLPKEIQELRRLETLYLSNTGVTELPKEIGKLRQLNTLNVSHTSVKELPREIGELQRLETLNVSHTSVWELPREIGKLQHLKTLNVSHTSVKELPFLLLLDSVIVFAGKPMKLSDDDLAVLRHLEKNIIISSSLARPRPGVDLSIMLYDDSYQLLPVAGLKIVGRHRRVPEWVKQHLASVGTLDIRLCKLEDDDLEYLCNKMPNLQHLTLRLDVLPRKAVVITGNGFSRLESFRLDGHGGHMRVPEWVKEHLANVSSLDIRLSQLVEDDLDFLRKEMLKLQHLTLRLEVLPRKAIVITGEGFSMLESFCLDCRLPVVTFQQGAMPKLKHLEFKFYTSRELTSEDPMGIRHLSSLKRVVFQSSPRYKSDAPSISAVINKVREEAKEHGNMITISINGKAEVVIPEKKNQKKAAVTSASDRTSEGSNVTNNGGAGGSSGASMIQTRPPIPYNDATDDEKGGNIIPVKSYYPFGITE